MLWPDVVYEPESTRPDGSRHSTPQPVIFNKELHAHYKKLIAIRRSHPALSRGSFETLYARGGVFAFARRLPGHPTVFVIFNRDNVAASLPNQIIPTSTLLYDNWNEGNLALSGELALEPQSFRIFSTQSP
jgi:glycosidase